VLASGADDERGCGGTILGALIPISIMLMPALSTQQKENEQQKGAEQPQGPDGLEIGN